MASPGPQGRLKCLICQFLLSDFTVSVLTKGVFMTASRSHEKVIEPSEQEASHWYKKLVLNINLAYVLTILNLNTLLILNLTA